MHDGFQDDDMEDFEPVIDADTHFFAALQTLNVEAIMSCWSESDEVTIIFPGIEMAKGPESVRLAIETITYHTSKLKAIMHPITVIRLGDIGWTFLGGTVVTTHGDETLSIEVYITNIYVRETDGWKIIHHHSTPGPSQPPYFEQRMN